MSFSIIVPVYNQAAYVEECVNSVLLQGVPDEEIILVNDGSTDETPAILERLQKEHPDTIRVIHQDNQGVFEARHNGFRAATGDYVLFLDSDDRLNPDSLTFLNREFQKNQADLILFNLSSTRDYSVKGQEWPFQDGELITDKEPLYKLMCTSYLLNHLGIKCFKRSLLKEDDFRHPEGLRLTFAEDLYLTIPMVAHASCIEYVDRNIYYYRDNVEGATHRYHRDQYLSMIETVNRLCEYTGDCYVANYAGLECYNIMTKVFRSNLSLPEKRRELKFIKSTPFYEQYAADSVRVKSGCRRILARLFRSNSPLAFGILELLYKLT